LVQGRQEAGILREYVQRIECLAAKLQKTVERLALNCGHSPAAAAPALHITTRTDDVGFTALINFGVVQRISFYTQAALKEVLKNIPATEVAGHIMTIQVFGNIAVFAVVY
jgi:hypothetical protein